MFRVHFCPFIPVGTRLNQSRRFWPVLGRWPFPVGWLSGAHKSPFCCPPLEVCLRSHYCMSIGLSALLQPRWSAHVFLYTGLSAWTPPGELFCPGVSHPDRGSSFTPPTCLSGFLSKLPPSPGHPSRTPCPCSPYAPLLWTLSLFILGVGVIQASSAPSCTVLSTFPGPLVPRPWPESPLMGPLMATLRLLSDSVPAGSCRPVGPAPAFCCYVPLYVTIVALDITSSSLRGPFLLHYGY